MYSENQAPSIGGSTSNRVKLGLTEVDTELTLVKRRMLGVCSGVG